MNNLKTISVSDCDRWDSIVRSFMTFDVYYLNGYVKAFQLHGDGEPLLFYYEGQNLRGINVVMKRDIALDPHFRGVLPENTYYDFATPYGYGGWLIEGDGDPDPLFVAYDSWCQINSIVSEFVRFHPVLKNSINTEGYYEVFPLGGTIAIDLTSPETIWENYTSKNRNMIRKAQKNGVKIYNGRSSALFKTFKDIYDVTMDKDGADSYYYFPISFYESILNDLPQSAQVFYAEKDGITIATAILLRSGVRLNYHLSGSKQEFQNLAPTNLLLHEAALWGYANGCQTLHLGGGVGSGEDSLYRFKKSFYRGDPCQYYIGKKIFLTELYDELVSKREALPDNCFFPRYRA